MDESYKNTVVSKKIHITLATAFLLIILKLATIDHEYVLVIAFFICLLTSLILLLVAACKALMDVKRYPDWSARRKRIAAENLKEYLKSHETPVLSDKTRTIGKMFFCSLCISFLSGVLLPSTDVDKNKVVVAENTEVPVVDEKPKEAIQLTREQITKLEKSWARSLEQLQKELVAAYSRADKSNDFTIFGSYKAKVWIKKYNKIKDDMNKYKGSFSNLNSEYNGCWINITSATG